MIHGGIEELELDGWVGLADDVPIVALVDGFGLLEREFFKVLLVKLYVV